MELPHFEYKRPAGAHPLLSGKKKLGPKGVTSWLTWSPGHLPHLLPFPRCRSVPYSNGTQYWAGIRITGACYKHPTGCTPMSFSISGDGNVQSDQFPNDTNATGQGSLLETHSPRTRSIGFGIQHSWAPALLLPLVWPLEKPPKLSGPQFLTSKLWGVENKMPIRH